MSKRNDLNTYKFTLKHDNGKQNVSIKGYDLEAAKQQVLFFECCPESAIKRIVIIPCYETSK